jgi:N-methylhydantoinase A/oxoprolinase/acetone carboxylase beta subunit
MRDPSDTVGSDLHIGVDVGGTFTDAVLVGAGPLVAVKVPTTREDQSVAVLDAVARLLASAGRSPRDVVRLAHGMTVGTNALLEGTFADTALVTTMGFGDLLELRRQTRADLYRLDTQHPDPVVRRSNVVEASERIGPDGVVDPLAEDEAVRVAERVRALDVEAVAVCLLFSFRDPCHEQAIAAALGDTVPGVHVSLSSEVLGEIREYERAATTAIDAALTPVLSRYLTRLGDRAEAAGVPAPQIMQSNGGLIDVDEAAQMASQTVLSGPAAGVMGAACWATADQISHALTFDMGGTSCDVALIRHGAPGRTSESVINGHPLHLPMLDIQTVSAGGGSVGWSDSGGALRVGPVSAGADPGPAAYARGGMVPTVTDAQVVLGRVTVVGTASEEIPLDVRRATAAIGRLADELGLSVDACAEGMIRIANHEMARALRVVSVERGVHPATCTIIAYGGAGPLHGCDVAELLGVDRVIAPGCAGVLAALGTIAAGERRDWSMSILASLSDTTAIDADLDALRARAHRALPGAEIAVSADCRYVGQSHALTVDWPSGRDRTELAVAFRRDHRARYGDADPAAPIEVVTVRVAAVRPGGAPEIDSTPTGPVCQGPRAIPMDGATLWIPSGWAARRCQDGSFDVRDQTGVAAWTR